MIFTIGVLARDELPIELVGKREWGCGCEVGHVWIFHSIADVLDEPVCLVIHCAQGGAAGHRHPKKGGAAGHRDIMRHCQDLRESI